ncbi:nuclease-related domain-containing protein [Nocardia lijiangensis]|uniref:nuclease-related domain-containing protein n=1 Tax=Nocardia lijiangensis TaxID=299618 RepID=UPI000832A5A7|nr:nuclease-related domain-containing protein [Nocardia lijiangensis]
MLVINERTAIPRSEQRVLEWMRTWTGQYVIVGLAISGCYIPERDRKGRAQEADLVVITPRAVVVLEVKGMAPEASNGTLTIQANGRWRLSGFEGDPIHVRDQDTSPFDQVTSNVFNLKALVSPRHPEAFVDGLVVVVPPRESTVTLNVESRRHGCGVVLGSTPGELRAWFHRTAGRRFVWTAEDVHALLDELNLGDEVTIEELVAEGFPRVRKQLLDKVQDRRPREEQPPWIEPDPDVEPIRKPRRSEGGGHAPLIEPEDAETAEAACPRSAEVPAPAPEVGAEATHSAVALETSRSSHLDEADVQASPGHVVLVEGDAGPSGSGLVGMQPSGHVVLVEDEPRPSRSEQAEMESSGQVVLVEGDTSRSGSEQAELESSGHVVLVEGDTSRSGSGLVEMQSSSEHVAVVEGDAGPSGSGLVETQSSSGQVVLVEDDASPSRSELAEMQSSGHVVLIKGDPSPARSEHPSTLPDSATESQFTDRWSSWILPDTESPRPQATSTAVRERVRITPESEPKPLRRLRPAPAPEARRSVEILGRTISVPQTLEGPGVSVLRDNHRAQQLAACAVVALTLCAIWLMASTCSARPGNADESPRPVPQSEVVPPPAQGAEQSEAGPMSVPPVCFPFPPEC